MFFSGKTKTAEEQLEKRILLLSLFSGLFFVIAELVYAVYSHSQSTLTDALYDFSEMVFIVLLLFLTPLFHQPVSEKHPYGFFQLESFFLLIKNIMLISVTASVLTGVVEKLLSGGNNINKAQVALFQLVLGLISFMILMIMKYMSRKITSPTVSTEIFGWKVDVAYSLGMSLAFFVAVKLQDTSLAFLSPYFDQIIAIIIMIFMIPETIRRLVETFRELFLFSPGQDTVNRIKEVADEIMAKYSFIPVFYDIARTGRKLWVSVYFKVESETIPTKNILEADKMLNERLSGDFPNISCEVILDDSNI